MFFNSLLEEEYKDKKKIIFVDMDGVIVDYNVKGELQFKNRRPLLSNISTLERISHNSNIKLCILSVCRKDTQIDDKNNWLDEFAPFFKKENRVIISKESNPNLSSKELKYNYLKEYVQNIDDEKILFIDDDNAILDYFEKNDIGVDVFQDSVLID